MLQKSNQGQSGHLFRTLRRTHIACFRNIQLQQITTNETIHRSGSVGRGHFKGHFKWRDTQNSFWLALHRSLGSTRRTQQRENNNKKPQQNTATKTLPQNTATKTLAGVRSARWCVFQFYTLFSYIICLLRPNGASFRAWQALRPCKSMDPAHSGILASLRQAFAHGPWAGPDPPPTAWPTDRLCHGWDKGAAQAVSPRAQLRAPENLHTLTPLKSSNLKTFTPQKSSNLKTFTPHALPAWSTSIESIWFTAPFPAKGAKDDSPFGQQLAV